MKVPGIFLPRNSTYHKVPSHQRGNKSTISRHNVWCICGIVIGLVLVPGCGSKSDLYSARGWVFVDGKPASGAIVVFHPENNNDLSALRPSAHVGPDGSFVLEAQPGAYRVAVTWFDDIGSFNRVTGEVGIKLPSQFGDPNLSTLRAVIGSYDNEIPAFQIAN